MGPSVEEQELGYLELFNILARRWRWAVGIFTLSLLTALLFTLTRDDTYRSSMQMIIEPNFREDIDPAELTDKPSERQREIDYATQLNLMRSHELLTRAVESLTSDYPNLTAADIRRNLTISRVQEGNVDTRIVSVNYTDSNPLKTERVLEALQTVYQSYALERQEQRLNRGLSAINSQFEEARRSLNSSQADLKAFRQNRNVINPQQQAIALEESLNQVLSEQQVLAAQFNEASARYETLREQVSLSPSSAFAASRLSQSPRFQELLDALQQVELELAERRVVYADADPGVKNLLSQRENQQVLIEKEAGRIIGQSLDNYDLRRSVRDFGQLSELDINLVQEMAEAEGSLRGLFARQQSLVASEEVLRVELSQFPELIDSYNRLQPEVETQRTVLQQLLTQRELLSAQLARGGFSWQVVAMPQLGLKIGPNHLKNLMLGAAAGLILGGAATFLREALDSKVHTPEDLERQIQYPLLGTLPVIDSLPNLVMNVGGGNGASPVTNGLGSGSQVVTAEREQVTEFAGYWLALRDSLDLVYRNIQLHQSASTQTIAVCALFPPEGASALSLGLASSAARLGKRAVVVDANLRNSSLQRWLELSDNVGISSLRNGKGLPEPIPIRLLDTQVDVIPSGLASSDPLKVLTSQDFKDLVHQLESEYDWVIIDSPPAMGTADILEIANCCPQLVVTADLNRLTREDLRLALATLDRINVMGVVASGVQRPLTYDASKGLNLSSDMHPRELSLN